MENGNLKKIKIKNSFFILITEKLKKKNIKKNFSNRSFKNFYLSENAWKILKIVFKNFIIRLGKNSKDSLYLNKRTKFNSSDLIEIFKIQKYFNGAKEIFERSPTIYSL